MNVHGCLFKSRHVFFSCVKKGGADRLCELRCTLPFGRLWSEGTGNTGPGMLDEAFGREREGCLVPADLCYVGWVVRE